MCLFLSTPLLKHTHACTVLTRMHCCFSKFFLVCTRGARLCYLFTSCHGTEGLMGGCCRMNLCAQVNCSLTNFKFVAAFQLYCFLFIRGNRGLEVQTQIYNHHHSKGYCLFANAVLLFSPTPCAVFPPPNVPCPFFFPLSLLCRVELYWSTTGSHLAQRQDHLSAQRHP